MSSEENNSDIPEIFHEMIDNAKILDKSFKELDNKDSLSEDQTLAIEYQTFVVRNKIVELNDSIQTLLTFFDTVDVTETEERRKRLEEMRDFDEFIKFMVVLHGHISYLRSI